jgi:hypothetical protein
MTTQYTTILKLALPVQGELSGTWGDVVNDNITQMVEQAVAGLAVIDSWTANSHTLTTADGTTSESRCAMLSFTDTGTALTGAGTVICPANSKVYIAKNTTGQVITLKTSAGTGIAIPNGKSMLLFCDGTNVVEAVDHVVTLSAGTLTVTGLTTFASLKGTDTTTVTTIKDEDDMSSDSATALATQQSIKAYVDNQVGSFDTLAEVLAQGNTTGANDIEVDTTQKVQFRDTAIYINSSADGQLDIVADTEVQIATTTVDLNGILDVSGNTTLGADVTFTGASYNAVWDSSDSALEFADNAKAVFGAGDDLQIYHDGSHSYVSDQGTGNLRIYANDLVLANNDGSETFLYGVNGGAVSISYANSAKVTTTATGVDITGTLVSDGLTVDDTSGTVGLFNSTAVASTLAINNTHANAWGSNIAFRTGGTDAGYLGSIGSLLGNTDQDLAIYATASNGFRVYTNGNNERLRVTSAGNVGIGTPTITSGFKMEVIGDARFGDAVGDDAVELGWSAGGPEGFIQAYDRGASAFRLLNINNSLKVDASGNVGIGVVPPSSQVSYIRNVQIEGLQAYGHTSFNDWGGFFTNSYIDAAGVRKYISSSQYAHNLHFDNNGAFIFYNAPNTNSAGDTVPFEERMRIDADGNLLVGTTSAFGTTGTTINQAGLIYSSADADRSGQFDRTGVSDGEIVRFTKAGTTVGSIGSRSGVVSYIVLDPRSGVKGAALIGGSVDANEGVINPGKNDGDIADDAISFGTASSRFKNLYLSGGAYLGGTVAANLLDDYEEGTFTPVLSYSGGTSVSIAVGAATGTYVKVGRLVTVTFNLNVTPSYSGAPSYWFIQGFPFSVNGDFGSVLGYNNNNATSFAGRTDSGSNNALFFATLASGTSINTFWTISYETDS